MQIHKEGESFALHSDIARARYLILRSASGDPVQGIWRIKTVGPYIFTPEQLIARGYPTNIDAGELYAVYKVEKDDFFNDNEWNLDNVPFAVSRLENLSNNRTYSLGKLLDAS